MYSYLFVTHTNLQLYLVRAIVRDLGLPAESVLHIQMRGSFGSGFALPFRTLNGDAYQQLTGNNVVANRLKNRAIVRKFTREVLNCLAPGFVVMSPMYTYWYLQLLAQKAGEYHFLEDGFGSFRTLAEMDEALPVKKVRGKINRLQTGFRRLGLVAEQRFSAPSRSQLLEQVSGGWVSSPHSFPWLDTGKKQLVRDLFPAEEPGRYNGAVMLCLSGQVEAGYFSLPEYLVLLEHVMKRLRLRGVEKVYVKYHPLQLRNADRLRAYREKIVAAGQGIVIEELPPSAAIEGIAAGNRITLVTGYGTLALSVAQTGNTIWTYLAEILRTAPSVRAALPASVTETINKIAEPL